MKSGFYIPPRHGRIIEPFAGSARYSLLYPYNDVTLYDANPVVVDVWKYLIAAKKKDILALPDIESKVSLDTIKDLSDAERALIGFHLCRGKAKPRKVGHGQNSWNKDKLRIAELVDKVKHWRIFRADVLKDTIPNPLGLATWFIDPPYSQVQNRPGNSDRYPYGNINYTKLAEFIRSRNGFVIACEGEGADYLPFEFLTETNANTNNKGVKKSREFVYIQSDHQQIKGAKTMIKDESGAGTAVAEETEEMRAPTSEPKGETYDVSKRDEVRDLGFRTEQTKNGFIAYEILGDRRVPDKGPGFKGIDELLSAVKAEVQKTGVSSAALGGDEGEAATEKVCGNPSPVEGHFCSRPLGHEGTCDASADFVDAEEIGLDDDLGIDPDEEEDGLVKITETAKGPRLPHMHETSDPQLASAAGDFMAANNEWKEKGKLRKQKLEELRATAHLKEHLFKKDPENTNAMICVVGGIVIRLNNETKETIEVEEIREVKVKK